MTCKDCQYYQSGYMWNYCAITGDEYFRTPIKCTLLNEDGSINKEDPYFKNYAEYIATPHPLIYDPEREI